MYVCMCIYVYVGVDGFVSHVLQVLLIRFTQPNMCLH